VRVAAWVGERTGVEVPSDGEPVMVVLLLGIVTDYAVFFLSGMRKHLLAGERPTEAALRATAKNLAIVLTAGLIVSVGAGSLLVGRLEFFRAFGPGVALAVFVSLLVSITLIPALLGIFGRALFWPSLPRVSPTRPARRLETWRDSLAVFVASRPVAALVGVLALGLVALASRGSLKRTSGSRRFRAFRPPRRKGGPPLPRSRASPTGSWRRPSSSWSSAPARSAKSP
jgi:putative drug exporter of the RND superfamily